MSTDFMNNYEKLKTLCHQNYIGSEKCGECDGKGMETRAWLIKHNVPYHGITMQKKIGADVYIDDKCINIEDIEL